jgi:hypothetical protein
MQRFDRYFQSKMKDPAFKALYEKECHVCAKTVQIFAKVEQDSIPLADLAEATGAAVDALKALKDADYCDPELVIRLCRHLALSSPEDCPRLGKHY